MREALLGIPSDIASLERNYLLADDDLDLIGTRRRPENRLRLALHIALLRHPGQGWHDDTEPPAPLVAWLAEQIEVPLVGGQDVGILDVSICAHARGATFDRRDLGAGLLVSIRAPARGATFPPRCVLALERVSIRAPARGATRCGRGDQVVALVSIRAPARGATRRST